MSGGGGAPQIRSVFINCPFDDAYVPLRDALVLATVACGYRPRSAIETGTVASARMDRIYQALSDSEYSIHDLSRCTGEGQRQLARFNMPLELGMAMAMRYGHGTHETAQHDWMVLVPDNHPYQAFVSDLAGFDPEFHNGTPKGILACVVSWLRTRAGAPPGPTARAILDLLPTFDRLKQEREADNLGRLSWADLLDIAADTLAGAMNEPAGA